MVATSVMPSRSAATMTEASTVPSGEVVVAGDELGDPQRIGGVDRLNDELARGEVAEEAHLGLPTQAGVEQVGDLGDDKCRDDQGTWVRFQ